VPWDEAAAEARHVLVREYWDDDLALFRSRPGHRRRVRRDMRAGAWHYWWQAHALQVLLDGVEVGDVQAFALVAPLLAGVQQRSGGDLTTNRYYDDLAWMGLATLRAHRLGLLGLDVPTALARAVRAGHDPEHGGFRWRAGGSYLNVAAAAPAAILLAGVAPLAREPAFGELATSTATWLHRHLVDPSGLVLDGCRPVRGALVPRRDVWSYTVGAVAELDLVLAAQADGAQRQQLRARSAVVLRRGLRELTTPAGIWRDEAGRGPGVDAPLFRGILAGAVAQAASALPHADDLAAALTTQARAVLAARDPRGRVAARWVGPTPPRVRPSPPSLAAHLAGALTLAAAARSSGPP
jgi:predicted alpha-1,6-mannanase (GH76 family)